MQQNDNVSRKEIISDIYEFFRVEKKDKLFFLKDKLKNKLMSTSTTSSSMDFTFVHHVNQCKPTNRQREDDKDHCSWRIWYRKDNSDQFISRL